MSTESIPFEIRIGHSRQATTHYLPYGTRTLPLDVTNATGEPCRLWLRPRYLPDDFPATAVHGFGGDESADRQLLVHWGGGDEIGACVAMDEKSPLRDHSLRIWEVVPVPVTVGTSHRVYLNLTHRAGPVSARYLRLQAVGEEGQPLGELDLALTVPLDEAGDPVADPVRGNWANARDLHFEGSQIADYVPRWHGGRPPVYRPAGDLPGRLSLHLEENRLHVHLQPAAGGDERLLAEVTDLEWKHPQAEVQHLRPLLPELFHFCQERYYVLRLWFLWLNKAIGAGHEVPDAERIDLIFDRDSGDVLYVGTDFHYREMWGTLMEGERTLRATLGLTFGTLDDMARTSLANATSQPVANPVVTIEEELCGGFGAKQVGRYAHLPLLNNVYITSFLVSEDVRS